MMLLDLPDDLEREILSRVSSKPLWELRATCKRWYALFRDPRFVEKNMKMCKSVRESMFLSNHEVFSIGKDLYGLHNNGVEPSIELTCKLGSLKGPEELEFSQLYDHCDGLILCSTNENTRLVVWNPCTGQRSKIKPITEYRSCDTYALGYSTSSCGHGYKILRYWYHQNDQGMWVAKFEIYEPSSDSWRVLDSLTCDSILFCDGVSLKGNTYWVAGDNETGFFLMKLDFTAERFVRLPLPFQSFDPQDTAALSVVKDEKIAVLHQDILALSNVMRIWVTNKVDDEDFSWRSDFVLTVDFDRFDLSCVVNVTSFLLDEENKVAVCCDKDLYDVYRTRIYIVGEDMYKQVYKHPSNNKASLFNWPRVLTYVPSLVHIHKTTPKSHKRRRDT